MHSLNTDKKIVVQQSKNLYKWAGIFSRLQRNFFVEDIKLRREKQIEDFVQLNEIAHIKFVTDTDIFRPIRNLSVETISDADLVLITDQKFSRYPCPILIEKINWYLDRCSRMYLCLNSRYINIDNSYHDLSLGNNYNLAITRWLKKNLHAVEVLDLSLDIEDYGTCFTWAIPDRHYYISRLCQK